MKDPVAEALKPHVGLNKPNTTLKRPSTTLRVNSMPPLASVPSRVLRKPSKLFFFDRESDS